MSFYEFINEKSHDVNKQIYTNMHQLQSKKKCKKSNFASVTDTKKQKIMDSHK